MWCRYFFFLVSPNSDFDDDWEDGDLYCVDDPSDNICRVKFTDSSRQCIRINGRQSSKSSSYLSSIYNAFAPLTTVHKQRFWDNFSCGPIDKRLCLNFGIKWNNMKIECDYKESKLYIDGILKVTKTTHKPEPIFKMKDDIDGGFGICTGTNKTIKALGNSLTIKKQCINFGGIR